MEIKETTKVNGEVIGKVEAALLPGRHLEH